ncbi:MAG: ssDNA endodeoxyribonuclease [Bogoriella megaspora]|nr:MAG: ssDNA endodeoxyribonuclease [Bogoriella megaspora]
MPDTELGKPLLNAVSANARQLYLLLRCINFGLYAQIQISEEGLRFNIADSSVVEGFAFLERTLFTSFAYNYIQPQTSSQTPQNGEDDDHETNEPPPFQISLPSLLETLQILGLTDTTRNERFSRDPSGPSAHTTSLPNRNAFSSHILGLPSSGLCRLTYDSPGAPLRIHITEPSFTTTCELTTYEPPPYTSAHDTTIPFARDRLALKIIMRSAYLHNAFSELASTNAERITLLAKRTKPYFVLSAEGPLGEASVEFSTPTTPVNASFRSAEDGGDVDIPAPLLETFQVGETRCRQSYKFGLVRHAARAMQIATKVSVRVDEQGVLSLQFMIEVEGGDAQGAAGVSFVDFRFVPFIEDEEGEEGESQEGEDEGQTESE